MRHRIQFWRYQYKKKKRNQHFLLSVRQHVAMEETLRQNLGLTFTVQCREEAPLSPWCLWLQNSLPSCCVLRTCYRGLLGRNFVFFVFVRWVPETNDLPNRDWSESVWFSRSVHNIHCFVQWLQALILCDNLIKAFRTRPLRGLIHDQLY